MAILIQCPQCNGLKIVGGLSGGVFAQVTCPVCAGVGEVQFGRVDLTDINTKLDAIKAMLDSTVCGLQKMSSNLDDIMVKLDV